MALFLFRLGHFVMNPSPTRINWKKNLFFVWITQLLSLAGFSSAMPFIAIYIRDRWGIYNEHDLGLWVCAFHFFGMISFCLFSPFWGMLADRFGRKRMLLRAYYTNAILFPCFLLAPNLWALIGIRFVTSAFTGVISAAQTLVVTNTPEEHHGFALGLLSSAIWSGNLLGFAAGGLIVHWYGFQAAFLICGSMYLLAGILAHLFVRERFERPNAETVKKIHHTWQGLSLGTWLVFLLIIFTAIARRFDDPYVALMVEKIHGTENTAFHTGWISALAAVGGIFSGMVIGRLADLFSPGKIVIPALLLTGLNTLFQGISGTLSSYSISRFASFLTSAGLESIYLTILSRISPQERRGSIFGLAASLRILGILLSTLFSGGIIYFVGVRSVYFIAALLFWLIIPVFYVVNFLLDRKPE